MMTNRLIALALIGVWHMDLAAQSDPKIIFRSDRDGTPGLYIMNGDGSGQARL